MKVCVGIVTHNRAGILPRALDSVREQSWKDIEVVVIDDGSTDETSALSARYPEVKWIRYEKPRGYRHARNRFMRETDAAYFVSLDDDSWFLKGDEIQIAMAMMADNGRLGAIAFDIRTPDFPAARERGPREPVNTFVGCGHLLRLEAVRAAGYYEDVPGDYGSEEKDLSIQLLDMGYEIVRLPGVDVWHEQTMVMRDLRGQHRSGVCNDLAFALRRCPSPSVAWVIPAKIFNHLVFSLRFGLRGKAGLGEFDRKVVDKIGMLGFVRPSLSGTLLFLKNLPSLLRNRRPVSPYAYRIYVERSRRRRWSQFGGTVAAVGLDHHPQPPRRPRGNAARNPISARAAAEKSSSAPTVAPTAPSSSSGELPGHPAVSPKNGRGRSRPRPHFPDREKRHRPLARRR
ncbi:MAG: glycosyltransferase [Verrucomicrobiales bacterium]